MISGQTQVNATSGAAEPAIAEKRVVFGLSLAIAIGALLRFIGLNRGLWWDEIYFLVVSVRKPLGEIVTVFPGDNQHPLYSILARFATLAFGEHAWSIRLPAAIFGIATIWAIYLLATLVTSKVEGLLAAAFLSVSYHHVWFSQNARGYTALAFWAVMTTYFLLRGLRTEKRGPWIAYGVLAALGLYTHLTMAFLVAAHAAILAAIAFTDVSGVGKWQKWKNPVLGFAVAAILTLLFYGPILTQVQNFFLHKPSSMRAVSTPSWALREMLRVLGLGLGTWVMLVVAGLLGLAGAISYFRQEKLIFAVFALPVVFTAGGAFLARGTMYPRFYFFLIGFGVIILIRGVFEIPKWFPAGARQTLTLLLSVLLLSGSSYSLVRNFRYPKQDFDGAIQFVRQVSQPEDNIATAGASTYPADKYYGLPWTAIGSLPELRELCNRGERVWLVYTFPRYLEGQFPGALQFIRDRFHIVRVFPGTVGDGDVFVARYPRGSNE